MNTSDKNPSSDSPPNAVFSAASLYGASLHGLKLNKYKRLIRISLHINHSISNSKTIIHLYYSCFIQIGGAAVGLNFNFLNSVVQETLKAQSFNTQAIWKCPVSGNPKPMIILDKKDAFIY